MTGYFVVVSGKTWHKLGVLAGEYNVPVRTLVEEFSGFEFFSKTPGEIIHVPHRSRPVRMALNQEVIERYKNIAFELSLLSERGSKEYVGLVLESYFNELISFPNQIHVEPLPINRRRLLDISLSRSAWNGLKQQYGEHPSRLLDREAASFRRFALSVRRPEGVRRRRQKFRLHIRPETLTYFAREAMRLGLEPVHKHGLISWASLFLEELGGEAIVPANFDRGDDDARAYVSDLAARTKARRAGTGRQRG